MAVLKWSRDVAVVVNWSETAVRKRASEVSPEDAAGAAAASSSFGLLISPGSQPMSPTSGISGELIDVSCSV
jgi:hypothetical protein